jgi:hypothetical protein
MPPSKIFETKGAFEAFAKANDIPLEQLPQIRN